MEEEPAEGVGAGTRRRPLNSASPAFGAILKTRRSSADHGGRFPQAMTVPAAATAAALREADAWKDYTRTDYTHKDGGHEREEVPAQ